jgi:hypothetical protein
MPDGSSTQSPPEKALDCMEAGLDALAHATGATVIYERATPDGPLIVDLDGVRLQVDVVREQ